MTAILLDTIVNETIQNFRDRGLLEAPPASGSSGWNLGESELEFSLATALEHGAGGRSQEAEMGSGQRLFWVLLFSLMVLIAAGGNVAVIYIVSTNKEMKSVTNYFLVNLSLADTMVSTLNVIFNFISMLHSHWPFGEIYCKISNFIAIVSISASVFTLTAISCDRYNAIIYPLRPRMSHRHAIGWILLIWTLSSALAMPNLILCTLFKEENSLLICALSWPDGRYPESSYDHLYNIIILVVTYLVPISTMAILYYKVGRELWGYEAIGENVDKQRRAIKAKKKIVKMMIVVVIIFALCWLPFHAFFIVSYYMPNLINGEPLFYQRCYLFIYWLAMSNSMYNPIIIYFMNSKFCHEFKRVFWLLLCCRTYSPPVKSDPSRPMASAALAPQTSASSCLQANNGSRPATAERKLDSSTSISSASSPSLRQLSRASAPSKVRKLHSAPNFANNNNNKSASASSKPIEVVITQSMEEGKGTAHSNLLRHEQVAVQEREPFLLRHSQAELEASPRQSLSVSDSQRQLAGASSDSIFL